MLTGNLLLASVLSYALKRKIEAYDPDQFREDCKIHMQELLDEPAFWSVLERMYFSSQDIFRVSPLFYFFTPSLMVKK